MIQATFLVIGALLFMGRASAAFHLAIFCCLLGLLTPYPWAALAAVFIAKPKDPRP